MTTPTQAAGATESVGGPGGSRRWAAAAPTLPSLGPDRLLAVRRADRGLRPRWGASPASLRTVDAAVVRALLAAGAGSVLEAGPGSGLLAAALTRSGLDVALCDPLPEAVLAAEEVHASLGIEPWPAALLDEAEALGGVPEMARAFDATLAVWVAQQAQDPARFVASLAHVARRVVVLAVPAGWQDPPLDVWRFDSHRDVLGRLGLESGAFSDVDVERLRAGPGEPGDSFLVVGRVRR